MVNVIRLLISQGKQISEICEEICELCLAPDTNSGAGIGCDNMTILIVAILNGRTLEEWSSWITDRVENKYGHETPDQLPQLYSASRLMSYRARRDAWEARQRDRDVQRVSPNGEGDNGSGGGFALVLGSNGGISVQPGHSILGGGRLMFDNDDSHDDSDDDSDDDDLQHEGLNGNSGFSDAFDFHQGGRSDITKSLREQLDELERDGDDESSNVDGDGDVHMGNIEDEDGESTGLPKKDLSASPRRVLQGEAPPPPKPLVNGDAEVEQLESTPGPDTPSPAVKAEGLLDSSESPLKV